MQFVDRQVISNSRGCIWCLLFGIVLAVRETILTMFEGSNENVKSSIAELYEGMNLGKPAAKKGEQHGRER